MTYDTWRTRESAENEREESAAMKRALRLQWFEDHADQINEERRERRLERHENPPLHHESFDLY